MNFIVLSPVQTVRHTFVLKSGGRYVPRVEAVCLERGFEMDGGSW